jgi:hypothetical protein
MTITNSTFSNNSAGSWGGGISNFNTAIITNSTIANNSANSGSGGGAYNFYGTLTLINNTFSGNSAASAGGIYNNQYGTLNFANTIIANSPSGGDCVSVATIGTNVKNLVEDGTCSPFLNGDPNLGPLADNGGPTQTMALLAGSRALDAGDNATCVAAPVNNLDQRGVVRPQGASCDIGAYEEVDPTIPTVRTFTTASLVASFDIPIISFTASDDVGVTGYRITESATAPLAGDTGWSATAPATYTVSTYGNYILYPWVKDEAGNVSLLYSFPSNVIVTPITAFSISGNVGVGGATLTYNDNGPKSATSAPDGSYSISIPYNWSGTITPALAGYIFTPQSRSYVNVTGERVGENYASALEPTNTPTRTPTPTHTPTSTATFTPTETPSETPTASNTFTPTSSRTYTATNTPTFTPTMTNTATASDTPTATFTPTTVPTLIVDNFDGTVLNPAWQWYLPVIGPTYSLSTNPGSLELAIPPGANHWTDLDNAPELRRSDMGNGDWNIETHIALDDSNSSDGYDINLVVGFDRYDQLWLSVTSNQRLRVTRVGEGDSASTDISLPVSLRIEKRGPNFEFKYMENDATDWSNLDTRSVEQPVAYIGAMGRNWSSNSGEAVFDLASFSLERYGSPDPGPYTEIVADNFTGPNLSSGWEWYVPKPGPAYSVNNGFNVFLPAYDSYERWGDTDDAPQLRRIDLGDGDWAIESGLVAITAVNGGYVAGLEVGFDQYDQIMAGIDNTGRLIMQRTSDQWPDYFGQRVLPVYLRLEKHGQEYTLEYRYSPNEAWTVTPAHNYPGTPQNVGLIARVLFTGDNPMEIHLASFRLDRWPNTPSTPTPTPTSTEIPTDTPTNTPTEPIPTSTNTNTPTNTVPTSTPTFTPTRTVPTSTRTYTPTRTVPTSTRTYTPTRTVPTSTRTYTPTRTAPTPTRTYTPTRTASTTIRTFTPFV